MSLPKTSTLELVTAPHPALREVARAVEPGELAYARELGERMRVVCRQHDGVGLAANQVGVLLRVIVVRIDRQLWSVLVNPELSHRSEIMETDTEGCLSHPGVRIEVARHVSVRVRYLTPRGNPGSMYLSRMNARIVQHEIDHLDGINIVDKVEVSTR